MRRCGGGKAPIGGTKSSRARLLTVLAGIAVLVGCATMKEVLEGVDVDAIPGLTDQDVERVKSGLDVGTRLVEAVDSITPEQEYYIGRAAAATIIERYGVYEDEAANRYLNQLGSALAEFSDMPEVYSGYHFLILDSDEINAFAAPGAFILVTRGLLRCCEGEEELAAVLGHEIAHIQNRHAIKSIKSSRWTSVLAALGSGAAREAGGDRDLDELTELFDGVLDDVLDALIVNGYSRTMEEAADQDGVRIVERCGYSPAAMVKMLEVMEGRLAGSTQGFGRTHPEPRDRIRSVEPLLGDRTVARNPARTARFNEALAKAREGGGA